MNIYRKPAHCDKGPIGKGKVHIGCCWNTETRKLVKELDKNPAIKRKGKEIAYVKRCAVAR